MKVYLRWLGAFEKCSNVLALFVAEVVKSAADTVVFSLRIPEKCIPERMDILHDVVSAKTYTTIYSVCSSVLELLLKKVD